jgi:antitoxin MazE
MIYTKIISIGNSQGVRIPKNILKLSGIKDQICLSCENGKIVITPIKETRQGWAQSFQEMGKNQDDRLLDINQEITSTWDEQEWDETI